MWLAAASGCVTPWERSALLNDKRAEIGSVQGPTERRLRGMLWEKKRDEADDGDALLKPIAGIDDYHDAEQMFEDEQYAAAEEAFKKIAKKYKKSEIREDALFMQAEAAYAQEKYARAHDRYAQLIKDYPTTRHLDDVSQRMFKIAMKWLDHPEVAEVDEIQQVNHQRYGERLPPKSETDVPKRNVVMPNFLDKSKPMFDPQGNAISALKSIWTNDPTGPLADDALMLAASYYARTGDFVEADRHYTLLREQFPNSPHVQKAFELGSHVKLMSYQGSTYDGKMLNDSEALKQATLRLFPELESRERIEAELAKIEQAKADRLWSLVVYYEGKRRKKASATYCHMLLAEYPDSRHARKCRDKLEQYGPAYADGRALLSSYPDPPRTLWSSIFPPDDHGGEPLPPPPAPSTTKPERPGSKFALIKPKEPEAAERPAPPDDDMPPPPRKSGIRRLLPRPLPEDVDQDAVPAPIGQSRLDDAPAEEDSTADDAFDDPSPDAEDDLGAGHTKL